MILSKGCTIGSERPLDCRQLEGDPRQTLQGGDPVRVEGLRLKHPHHRCALQSDLRPLKLQREAKQLVECCSIIMSQKIIPSFLKL